LPAGLTFILKPLAQLTAAGTRFENELLPYLNITSALSIEDGHRIMLVSNIHRPEGGDAVSLPKVMRRFSLDVKIAKHSISHSF